MKLGRATIYYFDSNSSSDDNITNTLESLLDSRDWISFKLFDTEEVEIGEWYDSIDLNFSNCTKEQYEAYFDKDILVRFQIVQDVLKIMETSHITKIDLHQTVNSTCNYYNSTYKNITMKDFDWIKNRCEQILKEK